MAGVKVSEPSGRTIVMLSQDNFFKWSRSINNELQDLRSLAATNLRKEMADISSKPISNFSFEDYVIMYHQEAIRICAGTFSVAIDLALRKSRRRLSAEFLDPSSALDIESESDNETDSPPPLVPMVDDPLNIPLPDDSSEEISRTNRRILEKAISSLSDRIKFPLVLKYSDFMKSERDNEAGIFKFLHDRISETTLSNLAGLKKGQYSERACDPVLYYRFIYKAFSKMNVDRTNKIQDKIDKIIQHPKEPISSLLSRLCDLYTQLEC